LARIDVPTFELRANIRSFSLIPNPAAAAGGGLWVQRLSAIRNCTFEHNLALSSGASLSTRAIGGSIYVLQTSRGSEFSDVQILHSKTLCSGSSCIAAGAMFIGLADFNTSMLRMFFVKCHLAAVGTLATATLAEAWGGAIYVHDASAGMLRINHVQSSHCSAESSGFLSGGFMYFPRRVINAVMTNISIVHFKINSDVLNVHTGCLLAFYSLEHTIISDVTVISAQLIYPKMQVPILWGGFPNFKSKKLEPFFLECNQNVF